MPSDTASCDDRWTSGPFSVMRPSLPSSKASSSLCSRSPNETAPTSSVSRRWVLASAPMRPISAVLNSSMVSDERAVEPMIACTVASVFLTR